MPNLLFGAVLSRKPDTPPNGLVLRIIQQTNAPPPGSAADPVARPFT